MAVRPQRGVRVHPIAVVATPPVGRVGPKRGTEGGQGGKRDLVRCQVKAREAAPFSGRGLRRVKAIGQAADPCVANRASPDP